MDVKISLRADVRNKIKVHVKVAFGISVRVCIKQMLVLLLN